MRLLWLPSERRRCPARVRRIRWGWVRFALLLVFIESLARATQVSDAEPKRNVLLLNSYHQTTPWVLKITSAVTEQFRHQEKRFDLHVENIDTKRIAYDQQFDQLLFEFYRKKFERTQFAAIIASDNNAFDFLRAHGNALFGQTPVVFCGVNDFRPEMLDGLPQFTGVAEVLDVAATLRVALQLVPDARRVFVVNDQTETGLAVSRLMAQALEPYRNKLIIEYAPASTLVELEERLKSLQSNTFVLLGTYLRDSLGKHYPPDEIGERISRHARGPVFGVVDIFFDTGVVGGNLVSAYHQGQTAAKLALRILNDGKSPAELGVKTTQQNPYLFDFRALRRWNLPEERLPSGSIVTHRPIGLYEENKALVWGGIGTTVGLVVIILILSGHLVYRRRSEALLRRSSQDIRTIFNNAFDAFVVHDFTGLILDVNDRIATLFGCAKLFVLGKNLAEFSGDVDNVKRIEEAFRQSAVEDYVSFEWVVRRVDSDLTFPTQVILRRVDLGGKSVIQTALRDISERKQLDAELSRHREHLEELVKERTLELAQARDRAEVAARSKSTFLAHMSHEIRTPLNAILGFSRLMQRDPGLSSEQRNKLTTINRAGEHLLTLINGVLDMSRVEAGRVEVERKPFQLYHLIDDLTVMFGFRQANRLVSVELELDPRVPVWVRGDSTKIRQVLVNLLGNAVKFTPRGKITLRVRRGSTEGRTTHPSNIEFEVEDSGIGISESDLARVFLPFEQVVGTTATRLGSGLGLSISQHYVRLMGGELRVKSTVDQGSRFSFSLPLPEEPAPEESPIASQQIVKCLAPNQQDWRVLAVDDNPENLELLLETLRGAGFAAMGVSNGLEALEQFERYRPHAIFMDMMMPEMNGMEATRRLRELPAGKTVPIFVLTASVFEEDRYEVLAAGADEFIRKPFQTDEVFTAIERHLGVKYLYRETIPDISTAPPSSFSTERSTNFEALPEDVRRALVDATKAADQERIDAICNKIESHLPSVAAKIRGWVARYQYDLLAAALTQVEKD